MKVSIRDISAKTGFSPATISNALNHKKGVNKETARLVFEAAREMGYLTEQKITKICFVIFRKNGSIIEDTPFFPLLINGFEQECRHCGYEMVIHNIDQKDPNYERQVRALLAEEDSAPVILSTEMMDGDLEIFKEATCPIVILDHWTESMDFNAVLINNADSARMATEYLIQKGHTKIGYIRGAYRIKGFRSRSAGFQIALRKHKLPIYEKYQFTVSTTMNGAYHDMLEYLEKKPELPTAFFADNDLMALGVMKAFQEKGYRIPEDISIVGFDDLPFTEISTPRLTTIHVPNKEMGKIAVKRIVQMINGEDDICVKIQVCTKFVERDTVKDMNQ